MVTVSVTLGTSVPEAAQSGQESFKGGVRDAGAEKEQVLSLDPPSRGR